MSKYEKALERIKKNVFPNDDWTEEDYEHFKTVVEALEQMCLIKEMHKS
jgi:hypothetical protein